MLIMLLILWDVNNDISQCLKSRGGTGNRAVRRSDRPETNRQSRRENKGFTHFLLQPPAAVFTTDQITEPE